MVSGVGSAEAPYQIDAIIPEPTEGGTTVGSGTVNLDDYGTASDTDDDRLTLALTDVKTWSNTPGIQLPNRALHFSLQRTLFDGLKILGANPGGPMNQEIDGGKYVANRLTYDGPGFWWSGDGSTIYDIYMANMAVTYGTGSKFLQNPTGNLFACQWHNMSHYQANGVFGDQATKVLMTQCIFSGHWQVGGFKDMVFHLGGSDNSLWESGYLNIDTSQMCPANIDSTKTGVYYMSYDAIGKTHVGTVYCTVRSSNNTGNANGEGWRGIEAEPTTNNPHLTFDNCWFEGTPSSTSDGILFRLKDGTCHIHNLFFGRALAFPNTGSERPLEYAGIQVDGGSLTIDQATYDRQLAPSTVPAIAVTAGTLRVSNVFNTNGEQTIVANLASPSSPTANVTIVADDSVLLQPDLSSVVAKPPVAGATLHLPGTTTDYLTSGVLTGYTGSDFDFRAYIAPDVWNASGTHVIFSHSDAGGATGAGQRSLVLYLISGTNPHVGVIIAPDGNGTTQQNIEDTSGPPGRVDGAWMYLRATYQRVNAGGNGLVTFYTSTDGASWTQYDTKTVIGQALNHVSTHRMSIGIRDNKDQPYAGGLGWVQVRNGIGGSVIAEVDFRNTAWSGTDSAGNKWRLVGKGSAWSVPLTGGATGPAGPPGTPATVSVGSTTTLSPGASATVTDSDPAASNAVLNFGIPQGVAGAQGPKGDPGATGATGPQGNPGLLVLSATAPIPGGTPAGTVILRTAT